jgi:flagellar L-ring protein FlgH
MNTRRTTPRLAMRALAICRLAQCRVAICGFAICCLATGANAQTGNAPASAPANATASASAAGPVEKGSGNAPPNDTYDALYERYLSSARTMNAGSPTAAINWMVGLSADRRARGLNDLVTIHVLENLQASGTADAALNKSSSGSVGVPTLAGIETKLPSAVDPANLVSTTADTKFKGGGVTTRTGQLTATMTARVMEVLPNGDLVLEGVREIEINGDRQIVVLTGVARPSDIGKDNDVLSTNIGQLRIRYFGRGLMKDNLKPGFLIRMLNKIF